MFIAAYIYSLAWIISIISLIIALVLCIAVPELTTYRVEMPCYVVSLLISYIILLLRGLGPIPSSVLNYRYGIGLQFSFLAAFFWSNLIAYDLWKSLTRPGLNPERLPLLKYLTYGWGCPLFFVAIAVIFDKSKFFKLISSFQPRSVFFYGPVSAILILNLIFFVLTLSVVRSKVAQGVEKSFSLWRVSFELAVIMGLSWIMEVVSWVIGGDVCYWYFTDVINGLQGLFLLIVIARRPNVITWLKQGLIREQDDMMDIDDDAEVVTVYNYFQPELNSKI